MYCPETPETEGWKANQKILRVKVAIEAAKFFEDFNLEQFDSLPQKLQQFTTQDAIAPFYVQQKISPEISLIVLFRLAAHR